MNSGYRIQVLKPLLYVIFARPCVIFDHFESYFARPFDLDITFHIWKLVKYANYLLQL